MSLTKIFVLGSGDEEEWILPWNSGEGEIIFSVVCFLFKNIYENQENRRMFHGH